MLRVAIVAGRFPVHSETFVRNVAAGLIERGHEVEIIALAPDPPETTDPEFERRTVRARRIPSTLIGRWAHAPRLAGRLATDAATVARCLNPRRFGRHALTLRVLHEVAPFMGLRPYDIVHCQFAHLTPLALRLRTAGVLTGRLVTSLRGHDITRHVRRHGHAVYADLWREGDHFLPNCEYFAGRVRALGCPAQRTTVFRSGLDARQFPLRRAPPAGEGIVRIGAVGRLVEKKGLAYAIRAIAALAPAWPGIQLDIVGDGPLRAELEHLIRELGVARRVRLRGALPAPEVAAFIRGCHLFLAPCVEAANGDMDGPVNVLKEAMATGLPVVATRHGGIPELVQDGVSGVLVPERDANALARAIRDLLTHPARWHGMGRAGAAFVRAHYDLEEQLDLLERVYRSVVG